ncbi:flagellar type III secretion system pore protein FliP [uncultured Erythrobacter sp.]|uniref:flagellar type III secretion system pore protein FliP n=1 Tax=uncultured Erythrobacter sp. TaxID=263913 RepID=UPI002624F540|nr:flagellar type III secretion system pore protein FliP [uncultured Erythrobacter sp.]
MIRFASLLAVALMSLALPSSVLAATSPLAEAVGPVIAPSTAGETEVTRTALLLGLLAVIPALIVSTTSFIRIVIVLAMVRHAFGMPQTPPNIVLVSLALFMSAFLMGPTFDRVNDEALTPFLDGSATTTQSLENASEPMKEFMLRHTRESDIEMVYSISRTPLPETADDIEILKLIPAFVMNELRVAFTIGFVIMLPFLLIDLVVASILLSLGMMMVPPQTISLPIKVLMFVLIDGWSLVLQGLIGSFV